MEETDVTNIAEEQSSSETPEDVAILYSWANLHGAKYRDFSASRREYRAQIRHRAAQELREAELKAKEEAEAAAAAAEEAARAAERAANSADASDSTGEREKALQIAEESARLAAAERVEAARRAEAAALAEAEARREEREIAEAHASAQRQAARYHDSEIRRRSLAGPQPVALIPGQIQDPYVMQQEANGDPFTPESTLRQLHHDHQKRGDSGIFSLGLSGIPRPNPQTAEEVRRRPQGFRPDESSGVRPSFRSAGEPVRTEPIRIEPIRRDPAFLDAGRPDSGRADAGRSDLSRSYSAQASGEQLARSQPAPSQPVPSNQPAQSQTAPVQSFPAEYFPQRSTPSYPPQQSYDGSSAGYPARQDYSARQDFSESPAPFRSATPERESPREPQAAARNTFDRQAFDRQAFDRQAFDRQSFEQRGYDQQAYQRSEQPARFNQPERFEQPGRFSQPDRSSQPDRFSQPEPQARPEAPQAAAYQNGQTGLRPAADSPARSFSQEYRAAGSRSEEAAGPAWLYGQQQTSMRPAAVAQQPLAVADTLQHSRERVASRWYALKGVFDAPGQEDTLPAPQARQREVRTPLLAVFSLSGGVGKTSIVATLGRSLSSLGEKVLLADTTAQALLPYYFGASELRPGVVRTFSPPSGSTDAPIHMVSYDVDGGDRQVQETFADRVAENGQGVQRLLFDLNAQNGWMLRCLSRMSPTVLIPVFPDMNSVISLHSVERYFQGLTDSEGRSLRPYFVLNQFDASLPLHLDVREVLRRQLGDRLLPYTIRRAPAVSEALAEGMTVVDYAPEAQVAEDYLNLANWLRSISAPATSGFRTIRWSER